MIHFISRPVTRIPHQLFRAYILPKASCSPPLPPTTSSHTERTSLFKSARCMWSKFHTVCRRAANCLMRTLRRTQSRLVLNYARIMMMIMWDMPDGLSAYVCECATFVNMRRRACDAKTLMVLPPMRPHDYYYPKVTLSLCALQRTHFRHVHNRNWSSSNLHTII